MCTFGKTPDQTTNHFCTGALSCWNRRELSSNCWHKVWRKLLYLVAFFSTGSPNYESKPLYILITIKCIFPAAAVRVLLQKRFLLLLHSPLSDPTKAQLMQFPTWWEFICHGSELQIYLKVTFILTNSWSNQSAFLCYFPCSLLKRRQK